MTSVQLSAIVGVVLSLLFSYVPGLSSWFDKQPPTNKRLVMAALLLLVALASFGLSCGNIIVSMTCDKQGLLDLISAFIAALVANQATFLISPERAKAT